MPNTATPTPEDLQQQAAELEAQAARARAELQAQADAEAQAERQRQAQADRHTVDSYDRGALDRDVEQARQEFLQAVAEWPVTKALAHYIAAGWRRNWAWFDLEQARGRLGLTGDEPRQPEQAHVQPMQEAITLAAERLAQAQVDAERAQG